MVSPSSSPRKSIIILAIVLAAVVLASVVVLMLLPGGQRLIQVSEKATPAGSTTNTATPGSSSDTFRLNVLQRPAFTTLNNGLIQSGILPVRPPAGTGKANPFL